MTNEKSRKLRQLELREQIRGDGVDFWAGRSGWPISAAGKVYLLEAIEAEGQRMFGTEWTGAEQAEQFFPILLDDADVVAGGLEEIYAINLLGTYRPDVGRSPVLQATDEISQRPLSDEEWRIAFSIFKDVVSPARIASLRRLRAVTNSLHKRLVGGEVEAWSRSLRGVGDFRPIDKESWTIDIVMARFLFGIFDPHEPLQDAILKIAPHRIKTSQLPEELWPEFIFLNIDQLSEVSGHVAIQRDVDSPKPKTREDVENVEAEAERIYQAMLGEDGRVKRRDFEARCSLNGIRSTTSRYVFSRLNSARPGQRN